MPFPILTEGQLGTFLLVFLRMSAMVMTMPVLGERSVPARVKGGLSLLLAFMLTPLVPPAGPPEEHVLPLLFLMVGEVMIGVIIGFTARVIFAGVQLAGEVIGVQMGLSIANVIDPLTNTQASIIAEMQYLVAMLVFLSVDGHHIFLGAAAESFRLVSPLGFHYSASLMRMIVDLSRDVFVVAVKVSGPLIVVMFLTNVGFGVVARTVPQINVFIVGFPLQLAMGFIFLGITAPVFVKLIAGLLHRLGSEVGMLLRIMG